MKTRILLPAALGLALLGLMGCPKSFVGSALVDEIIAEVAAAANSADRTNVAGITVGAVTGGPFTAAAGQIVQITFGGDIDTATLTAVTFYNLTDTAATDGAYTRGTVLAAGTPATMYNVGADQTTVRWTVDLSAASATVEVFVDPAVLTASGGARRLDTDGDNVQGEARDDDRIRYFTVGGGSAVAGAQRNPQDPFPLSPPGAIAAATTSLVLTYADFATDATDYKAAFDATVRLQKFDRVASAFADVAYTSVYNTATGEFTMTIPATADGEVYRWRAVRSGDTWLTASKTVNGYAKKLLYDQRLADNVDAPINVGTDATYNLTATYAVSTVFDGNDRNGYVQLNVGGIGVEGIAASSVVAANLRLYDTSDQVYVPWTTAVVRQQTAGSAQKNDQIILYLNPAYTKQYNSFQVHIGPGVIDQGATTATTDDVKLGDWQNVSNLPLGWDIESGGASLL